MFRKVFTILAAASVLVSFSCNSGSFSGSQIGKGKKSVDGKTSPKDKTNPDGEPADDGMGNKPDDIIPDSGKKQGPTTNFIDIIGGLLENLKKMDDVDITVVSDHEIIFGNSKAFHIGDNAYPASTCLLQLDVHPVQGIRYVFEFDVVSQAADLFVTIETLCGIDYTETNFAYLVGNGVPLETIPLMPGQANAAFHQAVFAPGTYAVVIESLRNFSTIPMGDNDDYMAGHIRIRSNGGQVTAGRVRFE